MIQQHTELNNLLNKCVKGGKRPDNNVLTKTDISQLLKMSINFIYPSIKVSISTISCIFNKHFV